MPRQEKISRVVRIGQKAGGANCNSGSALESVDRVELSPNLPKADDQLDSQHSSDGSQPKEETKAREVALGLKRPAPKTTEESPDFTSEMQKMLESFGSDINKTLSAKKQRLEKLTTISLKTTNKKVEDSWKVQQVERQKLYEDFQKQTLNVLQQWELDLEKAKENEEKLTQGKLSIGAASKPQSGKTSPDHDMRHLMDMLKRSSLRKEALPLQDLTKDTNDTKDTKDTEGETAAEAAEAGNKQRRPSASSDGSQGRKLLSPLDALYSSPPPPKKQP